MIKQWAGNLNTPVCEFSDYVGKIKISAGIGSTCNKINYKLIEKHRPYFEQAYDEGRKEISKLVLKLDLFEVCGQGYTREKEIEIKKLKETNTELLKSNASLRRLLEGRGNNGRW